MFYILTKSHYAFWGFAAFGRLTAGLTSDGAQGLGMGLQKRGGKRKSVNRLIPCNIGFWI
jgi:hypothetical protein